MTRLPLLALLLVTLAAAAPAVRAEDDVADARAHFRKGAALYQAKRWRAAIAEFEAAYRAKPHGAIHFNVAQCREKLQEWPGALRAYTDYLREVPEAKDRAAVRAAIGRIEARLATAGVQALLVYTDPPGAEVRIDGRPRGRAPFHLALPPGPYAVSVVLEGFAPAAEEVQLRAEASRVVEVVLAPAVAAGTAPAPPRPGAPARSGPDAAAPASPALPDLSARPPATQPTLPLAPPAKPPRPRVYTWVAAGTAVAAVAAGLWFGAEADRKRDRLLDGQTHEDAASLAREAKSRARTANVLYGIAGAAGAAGVTLFFVEGKF